MIRTEVGATSSHTGSTDSKYTRARSAMSNQGCTLSSVGDGCGSVRSGLVCVRCVAAFSCLLYTIFSIFPLSNQIIKHNGFPLFIVIVIVHESSLSAFTIEWEKTLHKYWKGLAISLFGNVFQISI